MRRLRPSLLLGTALFALGTWACTCFGRTFFLQFRNASLGLGH